jgi:pimeloyl-ACP methyl ester carboxylesterase
MGYKRLKSEAFLSSSLLFAFATLLATGCGPSAPGPATQLAPLTRAETTTLQTKLLSGTPILPQAPEFATITKPAPSLPPSELPALKPQQRECRDFRAALPESFTQGYVTVPENWNEPAGNKIRVFYYARILRDAQKQITRPTVFFNGGPGASSHSSYEVLESPDSEQTAQSLSMIYIDQRGTGCSDPFPSLPASLETAQRLALYGSRSIVQDAEAVRGKLLGKDTKWRAFGQSFGGHITHRYASIAPQSLSAVYIHGHAVVSDPVTKVTERLRSQRRISRDYFARYPSDEKRLTQIRAAILPSRCFEDGTNRVCGPNVLDAAAGLLGFSSQWSALHVWIKRLEKLDDAILAEFVRTFAFGMFVGDNGFAAAVLSHLDVVPGYTDAAVCDAASLRLTSETLTEVPASWPINECRLLKELHYPGQEFVEASSQGDPITLSSLATSLARFPDLRFFLYSGALDSFVPMAIFSEETQTLSHRITYRNFDQSGHEGFYSEPQVWEDLNSR